MAVSEERKAKMRAYYQANKEKWLTPEHLAKDATYRAANSTKRLAAGRARRKKLREFVYAVKRQPCVDCGQTYPPYVMDLDHCRGDDKRMDVSSLIDQGASLKIIQAEVDKCDLVCANCHRLRTHKRRGTLY